MAMFSLVKLVNGKWFISKYKWKDNEYPGKLEEKLAASVIPQWPSRA